MVVVVGAVVVVEVIVVGAVVVVVVRVVVGLVVLLVVVFGGWSVVDLHDWKILMLKSKGHFCNAAVKMCYVTYRSVGWVIAVQVVHVKDCSWSTGLPDRLQMAVYLQDTLIKDRAARL